MSQYSNMFQEVQALEKPRPFTTLSFSPQSNQPVICVTPGMTNLANKLNEAKVARSQIQISEFGTKAGKEVAELSKKVTSLTTTGKMGEFGAGLTQILTLTESVKIDDLNLDHDKGMLNKLGGFFKKKKVEILAQFESTQTSIDKIVADLSSRQNEMASENEFLDQLYDANIREYHELGESIEGATQNLIQMNLDYEILQKQAETSTDQMFIQSVNDAKDIINLWEKQIDRLKRMQQIALLTAPEIRKIQAGNTKLVQKFNDLVNTTIPAWGKQLTLTILNAKQKENADLGNTIDDKTNAFFRKAAELNHQTAVATAKASERSVVDIDTLEFMQSELLTSLREVKAIEAEGRKERIEASVRIDKMQQQMKQEMLSWNR